MKPARDPFHYRTSDPITSLKPFLAKQPVEKLLALRASLADSSKAEVTDELRRRGHVD